MHREMYRTGAGNHPCACFTVRPFYRAPVLPYAHFACAGLTPAGARNKNRSFMRSQPKYPPPMTPEGRVYTSEIILHSLE